MNRHQLIAVLLLPLAACGLPSLALHPRLGAMDVEGHLGGTSGGSALSTALADLGLGEGEDEVMPRADFEWTGLHLSASRFTAGYKGTGTSSAEIIIGDVTYNAGTEVDTDLDLEVLSILHTWDLIPGEAVEAGIGFGIALVGFQLQMEDTAGLETLRTDESIPVPLLAARLGFHLGPVEISGVVGFLQISDGDNEASVTDLDVMAGYEIFSGTGASLGINVGYRAFDLEANYGDGDSTVDMDLGLSGIYYGISLAF